MYFETHAHYTSDGYAQDRHEVIATLRPAGVSRVLNIASDEASNQGTIDLAEQYDWMYATVGVHPIYSNEIDKSFIEKMRTLSAHEKVVALGEIGLDYFHAERSPREVQQWWFEAQLDLSKELKLPIIIHTRDAQEPTIATLKNANLPIVNGIAAGISHCFSGSLEVAKQYLDMGYLLGIGGVVTFKNAKKLLDVVREIPLEYLVIETDAPYLTPEPFRGKRNDSTKLKYVVDKIAELKGISPEEVAEKTMQTANRLFGLD